MATEIKLEDLLKKKETVSPTIQQVPKNWIEAIDTYLSKVVRMMELGNSIIENAVKLKGSTISTKSKAISLIEKKIEEKKPEIVKELKTNGKPK